MKKASSKRNEFRNSVWLTEGVDNLLKYFTTTTLYSLEQMQVVSANSIFLIMARLSNRHSNHASLQCQLTMHGSLGFCKRKDTVLLHSQRVVQLHITLVWHVSIDKSKTPFSLQDRYYHLIFSPPTKYVPSLWKLSLILLFNRCRTQITLIRGNPAKKG